MQRRMIGKNSIGGWWIAPRTCMLPPMFAWPRFADHLSGARHPEKRVASLLAELAEPTPVPSAKDVLSALFTEETLADAMQLLAPRLHHVGFVAPPELAPAAVEAVLKKSPFREQVRTFKSTVLVKELSSQLGRQVEVMIVQGSAAAHPARSPAVEIFIADIPAQEVKSLVAQETGCHVALALAPHSSFEQLRAVLHAHGCRENPLMRDGPLVNEEMHSAVLYMDVPRGTRTRRLEFIAVNGRGHR